MNSLPTRTTELEKALYKEGIELVKRITNSFCFKHRIKDREELHSYLIEKLALILNKYDESRQIPFKYFANKSLMGYAFNFVRDHGRTIKIPRKYSELYLKYLALKKKSFPQKKLSIEMASEILNIDYDLLSKAIEASSLKFLEINDFREFDSVAGSNANLNILSNAAAYSYIRELDSTTREILEDIFLDSKNKDRVFYNKGLTPSQGQKLLEGVISKLAELKED